MAATHLRHRARVVKAYAATRSVRGSEGRLFQVFLNLIVNAAQAIPEGHVADNEVRLSTRDDGDRIVVEVTDTGAGMDKAVLARIFTPFFTTKEVGQGTGLGLSISHGIVAALGGSIDVTSEIGVGTTFRVSLPSSSNTADALLSSPVVADGPPPLRVLIVDDEVRVAKGLARMLIGQGHDVHVAHSGRSAFEKLHQIHFDVALCDLMMPDVTGMELYTKLVGENHEIVERFVFMTGGAFSQQAQEFLERIGAERWLSKPIPMAELRKVVLDVGSGKSPSPDAN
jgi:CheY-like chemotaxis protein